METSHVLSKFVKSIVVVSLLACFASCDQAENIYGAIPSDGSGGAGDQDAGTDAADDAPTTDGGISHCGTPCTGECKPPQPTDFFPVRLVWFGADEAAAPACPAQADARETILHADPDIPAASCSECTCGPAEGSCALPSTITAHSALCNAVEGSLAIQSDPPLSWTGECSPANPIPAGITCNGLPCVQSVTLGALTIADESCAASGTSTAPLPKPTWKLTAKVCEGSALGQCDPAKQCVPAASAGFKQCVEKPGIVECSGPHYTDRHVYFESLTDSRFCSPCTCGAPEGSTCSAWISLYKDAACSALVMNASAWSDGPSCHDMTPPASSVGSKSASAPVYMGGSCQAIGGDLVGDVLPIGARTLCCLA